MRFNCRNKGTGRFAVQVWQPASLGASNARSTRGKQLYVGTFGNAVDAARAYDSAALRLLGEQQAVLNVRMLNSFSTHLH